ncbi:MAG: hypothetical protein ACI8WT_000664 [Clostridium sp.]|jgi:hypothetical protein
MLWLVIQIVLYFLTTILFMKISIKFGWSKALWTALERNINIKNHIAFYIISLFIFSVIVLSFCSIIGMNYRSVSYRIVTLIVFALGCAFMPPLAKISK